MQRVAIKGYIPSDYAIRVAEKREKCLPTRMKAGVKVLLAAALAAALGWHWQ